MASKLGCGHAATNGSCHVITLLNRGLCRPGPCVGLALSSTYAENTFDDGVVGGCAGPPHWLLLTWKNAQRLVCESVAQHSAVKCLSLRLKCFFWGVPTPLLVTAGTQEHVSCDPFISTLY